MDLILYGLECGREPAELIEDAVAESAPEPVREAA